MAKRSPGIKKANADVSYTEDQLIELYKCSIDPIYFITNYVKIRHPKHGQIKFNLHDYQRDMVNRYRTNRFNILLSARQTGKTETSCAFLLWYAIFHPDKTVLIASNKSSNAMELIGKIQYAYEELPHWLKPGIDDTNWNKHSCAFDNKSRIVASATSKDSGRGLSISLIYCDELAFVAPHVQLEFWDSILPTISTGGAMIITSTPNGDSNLFAREWFKSIAKTPEELAADPEAFIPLHVKWNQPPGRDDKFKKAFMDKLGERKWRQEFECEFLSSDLTLFDSYIISTQETEYDRRVERITLNDRNKGMPDYEPSYPFRIGTNHFWKRIEKDKTYIVGVDPATGSGEDYTVFQVFEFPSLFQVMEFRSNTMSPAVAYTQLKQLLLFLEQYTKDIYFSIESNGVGAAMLALYEADDTLPRWAHLVSDKGAKKTGMTTTNFTKTLAALKFKELFERNNMILNSKTLFHEMKNYVRREGSYAANIGVNDDCIAAVLIVIRILEDIATYDDAAYVRMYNVEAQIEMEGKWDYNKDDIERLRQPAHHEQEDESEEPMPFLI